MPDQRRGQPPAPVIIATPPESGFCSRDSAFAVFIPAIRILQPPDHSFCAKLILPSVFFAHSVPGWRRRNS